MPCAFIVFLYILDFLHVTCIKGQENIPQHHGPRNKAAKAGTDKSSIRNLFFPQNDWLDGAWESHPLLLSTAHLDPTSTDETGYCLASDQKSCTSDVKGTGGGKDDDAIPTVHLAPDSDRLQAMQNLFRLDDVETLVTRLLKRNSVRLVKAVVRDGEHTTDSFPAEKLRTATALDVRRAIERDGYSLVVAYMQRLWEPLALHHDPWGRVYLDDCNLVVTPAPVVVPSTASKSDDDEGEDADHRDGRALAAHFDHSDVIVFQLHGKKLWSVAKKPAVYLPFWDEQGFHNRDAIESFESGGKYDDFVIQPGDILYIPAGHAHNASAVPSGSRSDTSIHVSFGVGHGFAIGVAQGCLATVEALVHFALHDYFLANSEKDSIVVGRKDCPGSEYSVRWGSVLHLYLSAMSRAGEGCKEGRGACAVFRRSVLRRPSSAGAERGRILNDSLEDIYFEAINAYTTVSTGSDPVATLIDFISHLQSEPHSSSNYCFPAMGQWDKIVCPEMLNVRILREEFIDVLSDFRAFTLKRYKAVEEILVDELGRTIRTKVEEDEAAWATFSKP